MMNTSNEPILGLLKQTIDALPELICTLDSEKRVRWMNAAMEKRLGITPGEAEGLTFYEALHGKACPTEFCPLCQLLKDNQEHSAEVYVDRLGGDFLVTCTPLHDTEGQLVGSVHVARDITERKRAEEKLEKEHAFLQSVINSILGIFYLFPLTEDSKMFRWNDALGNITGYTDKEIGQMNPMQFMEPRFYDIISEKMKEVLEKESATVEATFVRKDGYCVPMLFNRKAADYRRYTL